MKQFKINKNYTNRSEESLDKYLVEINRIPMITPDQKVELAQIIRKSPWVDEGTTVTFAT